MAGIRKQSNEMKQIAKMLLAHRLLGRHTQTDIAKKLFVTFQQYQKWEKGINRISADQLANLCKAFHYDWNLFFDKDPIVFIDNHTDVLKGTKHHMIRHMFEQINTNVDKERTS